LYFCRRLGAMQLTPIFFLNNFLLGAGLAMDAFSVSVANGLSEPGMRRRKIFAVAAVFAFFQALMPLIGWGCIHTIVSFFSVFNRFIPWIALILLSYIGINMILEAKRGEEIASGSRRLGLGALLVQGVATSIDALSVGFTTADYNLGEALISAFIIAAVTFIICLAGVLIGRSAGNKLSGKAGIFGGIILIFIGLEIFIKGVF